MLAAVPPPGCDLVCVVDYWKSIDALRRLYPCIEALPNRWATVFPWICGLDHFHAREPMDPQESYAALNPVEAHLLQNVFLWGRSVARHGYAPVPPSAALETPFDQLEELTKLTGLVKLVDKCFAMGYNAGVTALDTLHSRMLSHPNSGSGTSIPSP